jgi:hypothetical protein
MKSLPLCVGCILFLSSVACNSRFSQADVAKAQEQITNEYQEKGFEVEQINLVKDSDRHLSGFVRIRKASGIIRPQLTKNCGATMDQDSGKYIWECK